MHRLDRGKETSATVSLFVFLGSPQNAMRMRIAATREVDNWEVMPEPGLHILRWPLDQSEYSVWSSYCNVKWFAFLNKRPQTGREGHYGNDVGTLRRTFKVKVGIT